MTDPAAPPIAMPQFPRRGWLPALALVAAVFIAYMRVWHAGFVWDDDKHVTENPCIVGPLGLSAIWNGKGSYYPLVSSSFWVQHALWGLNPLPFHLVDVALHAVCAALLWVVLRRLKVGGAWLGAAIWALHPVQVESAAWITEQKNTQSCFFYLLAILFFLKWREAANAHDTGTAGDATGFPRARRYALALLFATLAMLSKCSTVMLPVALALCWWWMEGRWRWRNAFGLVPFLMVSAAASGWTVWQQQNDAQAPGPAWAQTWPERFVIAGKDFWFYLWKLAWPHPLTFIYHRWDVDAATACSFVPFIGMACMMVLLWLARDGSLRPVFFAMAYFLVSLFPVLNFFNVYFFRYSFVGDHLQYLASMGPLALAGAGIAWVSRFAGGEKGLAYRAVSAALLMILGGLTFMQCSVYYNLESLWRATLADNPDAWLAHFNLAEILVRQGRLDEAMTHYREQLRLLPDSTEARGNLAYVLLKAGHTDDAIAEFRQLLSIDPDSAEGHGNLSTALLREGRVDEAIAHAQQAVALSRHTDETGEGHNDAGMLRILAAAYGKAGRYPEAIETAKMALQRAESQSNTVLAAEIGRELAGYEAGGK